MAGVADDLGDITWTTDEIAIEKAIENDTVLQEIANKIESDVCIEPDTVLNIDPTDSLPRDSDTASNSSSARDIDDNGDNSSDESSKKLSLKNGDIKKTKNGKSLSKGKSEKSEKHLQPGKNDSKSKKDSIKSKAASETDSSNSKEESSKQGRKNPLKMLKKLTKFDKSSKKSSFLSEFSAVVVDKLPQVFVVKYLGHRDVTGVSGLHHVRKPIDDMVAQVRTKLDAKEEILLPLLYVVVSPKGLDLREHPSNKVKGAAPLGVMPIDFISYGVQDIKYWKIFTCIVVRSLSWQSRSATCHAFMCDSPHSGRKMAVSLGAAFSMYAKKLKTDGKTHNFQVELRPPDELADELAEFDA